MAKEAMDLPSGEEDEEDQGPRVVRRAGDRVCSVCGVKLSLYNPGPHCWQHTVGWPWRGPSAKPRY